MFGRALRFVEPFYRGTAVKVLVFGFLRGRFETQISVFLNLPMTFFYVSHLVRRLGHLNKILATPMGAPQIRYIISARSSFNIHALRGVSCGYPTASLSVLS